MKCGAYKYDEKTGEFKISGAPRKRQSRKVPRWVGQLFSFRIGSRRLNTWKRILLFALCILGVLLFRGFIYVGVVYVCRFIWACLVWLYEFNLEWIHLIWG